MIDNDKLGTVPVKKLLFELSVPAILAQIVNVLYNLIDRIFIGHIGHIDQIGSLALTGVDVAMPLIMIISAFAALATMGGAPRASIYTWKKTI